MSYDFSDPKIRAMVDRHEPHEILPDPWGRWTGKPGVFCDSCQQPWPCPPIQELRAWQERPRTARRGYQSMVDHDG